MFIKKKRHFLEFGIILVIALVFALLLTKLIRVIHMPVNELELDQNETMEKILLDDNL